MDNPPPSWMVKLVISLIFLLGIFIFVHKQQWGVTEERKGIDHLTSLQTITINDSIGVPQPIRKPTANPKDDPLAPVVKINQKFTKSPPTTPQSQEKIYESSSSGNSILNQ